LKSRGTRFLLVAACLGLVTGAGCSSSTSTGRSGGEGARGKVALGHDVDERLGGERLAVRGEVETRHMVNTVW
jgi:hypothetical protein